MRLSSEREAPPEQRELIRKAARLEVLSLGYAAVTIVLVALVMGNSQAMRTAWIEDIVSTLPQFSFFIALLFLRRPPSHEHPYGYHRATGIGHLVAAVALLVVGGTLAYESITGLLAAEHPTIGTMEVYGIVVWQGWLMMGVMAVIAVPPIFLGRAKMKLAEPLHNKLLYADADMDKADWSTNAASFVGIAGIGLGVWWFDSAAALFISAGILWDGMKNTRAAVFDLMDERATTFDQKHVHPLIAEIDTYLRGLRWVEDAGSRVRDAGMVFHVEAFVIPTSKKASIADLEAAADACRQMDWKINDIVIIPVRRLPTDVVRSSAQT